MRQLELKHKDGLSYSRLRRCEEDCEIRNYVTYINVFIKQ